ncbi:hypothetical protein F5Y10DRAFT_20617 [Nemania abortiva]|nr:hypothetical protein F5Y10DRAFT_20617 [Nemania abortiva]
MGERINFADDISLYTIEDDSDAAPDLEDIEVGSQSCAPTDDDSDARRDGKEYLETPSAFFDVTATIKAPPVHGWPSWAPSILYRLDAPLVAILLFGGYLLHELSVNRASRISSISDTSTAWHGLLATLTSYGLAHISRWRIRWRSRDLSWSNTPTFTRSAAISIACAFVSIPIMQFQTIHERRVTYDGGRSQAELSCATLASWDRAFPNLKGSLPSIIRENPAEDVFRDIEWNSTDHWMVSDKSNGTLRNIRGIIFQDITGLGKGIGEDCWNGGDCHYEDGVYMPVLPLADAIPASRSLGSYWEIESQVLSVAFDCNLAQVGDNPELNQTNGRPSLSVKIGGATDCSVTATLLGLTYDKYRREALQRSLSTFESRSGSAIRKFSNYYRRLLLSGEELVAYTPSWVRMGPDDSHCGQKFAIVGLTSAALSKQSKPEASQIQAAICTPAFYNASVKMLLGLNKTSIYHDQVRFASWARPPPFDRVKPHHKIFFKGLLGIPAFDVPFEPDWKMLEPRIHRRLSEQFLQHVSKSCVPGSLWPFSQLREELGTIIWQRPQELGTLLMGGRLLRLSFLTKLSTAAGLALQERLEEAEIGGNWTSELRLVHASALIERGTTQDLFQARWSFRIFLYAFSLILTVLTAEFLFFNDRSVWPWDVTSVAARATLLCHSPVRQWLSPYGTTEPFSNIARYMRIGYWHVHELQGKSGWRVDNPTAEDPVPDREVDNSDRRFDHAAYFHLVTSRKELGIALVVYLVAPWLTKTWSRSVDIESQLVRLMGVADIRQVASVWSILAARLLPTSALLFICFVWLPRTYDFVRQRQPWAALKTPQPSRKSITLDYYNANFPALLAFKNHHWFIVTLAVGCILGFIAPVMQATLYRSTVEPQDTKPVQGVRHWDWTDTITKSQDSIESHSREALVTLIDSLLTSRMLPPHSSPNVALLGLDIEKAEKDLSSPFASFETSALRAGLKCEEANIEAILQQEDKSKTSHVSIQSYVHDRNNRQTHFERPCSSPSHFGVWGSSAVGEPTTNMVECIRWWLDDASTEIRDNVPRWLVVSSHGVGYWSSQHQDMQFTELVATSGFYCIPTMHIEQGQATVQVKGYDTEQASLVKYKVSDNPVVEIRQDIVATISKGLNRSNIILDGHNGGIIADEALIHTEFFAGDMLGFLMYRFACQGRRPCGARKGFAQDISQIFAAYVSILAGQSDLLKGHNPDQSVELHPIELKEVVKAGLPQAIYLICFILFCVGVATTAFWRYMFYRLPAPPEELIGGLQLLSCSSIVDTLENEIEHPELLSLRELYDVVDSWGHMYKLGRVNTNGKATYVVDVVAVFDDEDNMSWRYRDDPESESVDNN